jgi:hypothetical protein
MFTIWKTILYMHGMCCSNLLDCLYKSMKTYHIKLNVKYVLPEDEYRMFETYRREEELN